MGLRLKIKKIETDLPTPSLKREDAGLDLYSAEDFYLPDNSVGVVRLGIATEFDPPFVGLFRDRSSMAAKGITVIGGVIDPSYRGEWKVILVNLSDKNYNIKRGDRIVQCIFVSSVKLLIEETKILNDSQRGTGGFGSTGE